MATKVIARLIPWITPVIFLLSAQIAVEHGVLGLLGFTLMGMLSFIAIYFLQKKRSYFMLDERLKNSIFVLFIIETITCMINVVEIIVKTFFQTNSSSINILFILSITFIVLYLQKNNKNWLYVSMVILGLIFSFLIPILVYLKVSIPTVYSGLHFLADEMLRFDNHQTWLLIGVIGIILLTHQILYQLFFYQHEGPSKIGTYLLASLIWLVVPISLGSLAFLAKAQAIWPELSDQVSVMVISQFGGNFGQTLFYVTSIFLLISQGAGMLNELKERSFYKGPYTVIQFVILPLVIVFSLKITLLEIILYFGMIWGPLFGVLLRPTRFPRINQIVFAIGVCVAATTSFFYSITIGVIIGALSTSIVMSLTFYITSIKNVEEEVA